MHLLVHCIRVICQCLFIYHLHEARGSILLEKPTVTQLAKKFLALCAAETFMTMFILNWAQLTLIIHSSIILAYSPRYPMWSLPFKISNKVPLSHISYLCHCCLIWPSLHLVKLRHTPIIFTWGWGWGLLALRLYTKFMWVRSVRILCVLHHHENLVQIIYLNFIL